MFNVVSFFSFDDADLNIQLQILPIIYRNFPFM
jgi:hypothetical protein